MQREIFFPEKSRQFTGKRWLKIALRTGHLLGLAGVGAVFLFDQAVPGSQYYLYLLVITGLAMIALDVWSNGIWIYQLRGQAIIVKLLLFGIMIAQSDQSSIWFIIIVILSGVISHAPGDLRYYSIIHKKRLNSFAEKG